MKIKYVCLGLESKSHVVAAKNPIKNTDFFGICVKFLYPKNTDINTENAELQMLPD